MAWAFEALNRIEGFGLVEAAGVSGFRVFQRVCGSRATVMQSTSL